MTLLDTLHLLGLFVIFLGVGLLLYTQLLGVLLRLHIKFFPKLYPYLHEYEDKDADRQLNLTKHELDCLHSLITKWEQSVFSGANYIQQLRDKKEVSDWELRAITHDHYIKGLGYCAHGLREALSLPKKFSLQPLESTK